MKLDKTDKILIFLAFIIIVALIFCLIYAYNYVDSPKPQVTIATEEDLEMYVKNIRNYYREEDLIKI